MRFCQSFLTRGSLAHFQRLLLSENHETEKKYQSKMQSVISFQQVTVAEPRTLLDFAEHQKAELPGLLWPSGGSGREQHYYSLGFTHSQQSSWFLSEFSCLDQYVWLWQSDLCHSSANRSKQWMETSEQEEGGARHGVLLGVFRRWNEAGFVQVQTWQDSEISN